MKGDKRVRVIAWGYSEDDHEFSIIRAYKSIDSARAGIKKMCAKIWDANGYDEWEARHMFNPIRGLTVYTGVESHGRGRFSFKNAYAVYSHGWYDDEYWMHYAYDAGRDLYDRNHRSSRNYEDAWYCEHGPDPWAGIKGAME